MLHLLKNSLRCNIRNTTSMFWALLFPIILGTMFYFTIYKMDETDFTTIPVAVVNDKDTEQSKAFLDFLSEMEKDDSQIIEVEDMKEDQALKALEDKKVKGIFYAGDKLSLSVSEKGMEESILQSLLESYLDSSNLMMNVAATHPEKMNEALSSMNDYQNLVESVSLKGKTMNNNIQYFFTLIAMGCLYGCFLGIIPAFNLQANLTALAARRCIAPTHKLKMIVVDMFGTFIIHFLNMIILLLYLRYILGIGFDGQMGKMILVTFMGSVIGVSLGILVGSIGKIKESYKLGIMLGVSMVCSFLSGLMIGEMKDILEKHAPVVNRLNPAALISDAFYCINVYDDPARFARNLWTLGVMSALMLAASYWVIRRERYDSI